MMMMMMMLVIIQADKDGDSSRQMLILLLCDQSLKVTYGDKAESGKLNQPMRLLSMRCGCKLSPLTESIYV